MRIVQLVQSGDVAGGQLVALQIAHAARVAGHDVTFASPTRGPFTERAADEGFDVDVIPVAGGLDAGAVARLARALHGVDVVHTHGHFGVNVVGRVSARLVRARVVSHMHIENAFRAGPGRGAQVALDNATARLCDAIVAVSDATRITLVRQGYPSARTVTIHNGIEIAQPAEPRRLAEGPIVLEVARLAAVKGQRTLLAALARLDATAVLVGRDLEAGGRYEALLHDEARRLGVADRVVFAGYRDDVPALMAGCDVFCLPSSVEGLPLVLLEAMSRSKPVVATAVGGVPELVDDGETGLLVPPGDVTALREALSRLLEDGDLAQRLGAAAARRVRERFSASSTAAEVLRLYTNRA